MENSVCGAAGCGDTCNGILDGCFGNDLRRRKVGAEQIHDEFASTLTSFCFGRIGSRNAGESHGRNAEEFADEGHGVGRKLTAAGASAGARGAFESFEPSGSHCATTMRSDSFENVLDSDGMAFKLARGNRAAVQNEARNIQPGEGHDAARNGFVAADEHNKGIEKVSARHQLDGIGDNFPTNEGSAHAFRAHGDAVGDGYGVELERGTAGSANAVFDVLSELTEVIVARADFDPSIRHSHERLGEILIAQSTSAKHGASRRSMGAIDQGVTAGLRQPIVHFDIPRSFSARQTRIGLSEKSWGHHPVSDDGPESFRLWSPGAPSSAFDSPYDDRGNSYNHAGYFAQCAGRRKAPFIRDGDGEHSDAMKIAVSAS